MTSEKLKQAIDLIKAGNKQSALPVLKQIVQSDPQNETAWLWLYSCVESIDQKRYCLEKAISINPNNLNARKALEKVVAQKIQEINISAHQSPSSQKIQSGKQPDTSLHNKKKGNPRNTFIFGGLGVFILTICFIGLAAGGNWLYTKMAPSNNTLNDDSPVVIVPNLPSFESSETEEQDSVPTNIISPTTENLTSIPDLANPTVTPTPPDFRISAIKMERMDGEINNYGELDTSTGFDTFYIDIIGENHSDEFLALSIDQWGNKQPQISTSEGYTYNCLLVETTPDLYFPKFRWKINLACKIPELTTGHIFHFPYEISSVNMLGGEYSTYKVVNSWTNLIADFPFTPMNNPSGSMPIIEAYATSFMPKDIPIHFSEEPITLGDVTITFHFLGDIPTVSIKNNYIGGRTEFSMEGVMFIIGDGFLYDGNSNSSAFTYPISSFDFREWILNPAEQIDNTTWIEIQPFNDEVNTQLLSEAIKKGGCVLFNYIEVVSDKTFINEKPEMVCFNMQIQRP